MTEPHADSLELALKNYEQALRWLEQEKHAPTPSEILTVLVARDGVQALLVKPASEVSASALIKLDELDDRLKQQTQTIAQTEKLSDWRSLLNPPESSWWWFLKLPTPKPWWDQFDGVCNLATIAFMTTSVALILNTSSRFFVGGADAWGALAIVSQSVLALITGGSLTQKGRAFLDHTFTGFNIPKHYWQEMNAVLSLALLLTVLGFRATLPQIATRFNESGLRDYQARRLDSALTNYQQAIALRPDYAEAHYYLGLLYEDLQKTDQAIAEYQLVTQGDSDALDRLTLLRAYNNLGRLHLLKGNSQAAWIPLERALNLIDATNSDPNIVYEHHQLLKNLGWVRLQQKYYFDAANLLQEAIELQPAIESVFKEAGGRAAPYCLQAQVLEGQKQDEAARAAWDTCVQYAQRSNPDEALWIGMARERQAASGATP